MVADVETAFRKLSVSGCDLRVPPADEVKSAMNTLILEEDGWLNYDEYLILLFKVLQDSLE